METKYYVDADGVYLGGFNDEPPANSIEVPLAPVDARQVWDGTEWGAPPAIVPESVSARQFKLQLLAANLLDQVNGWIATQPRAVQIAYEYSGSFVRSEPMMAAGFTAMGFTDQQIDQFFTAAAKL